MFTEEWEYWEPDPEIAEVMERYEPRSFALLDLDERRLERTNGVVGYRFGRGNPDRWLPTRLKRVRRVESREAPPRSCKGCQRVFWPKRRLRCYCSRECFYEHGPHGAGPGSEPYLPDKPCAHCKKVFHPRTIARVFCTPKCANLAKRGPRQPRCGANPEEVKALYLEGMRMQDIADRYGVQITAIKRLVRRLGVPRRPPHRQKKAG